MKKELLAGTKGLVTTLMVAMVVVCIFQLFSAIGNFANRNNYVLSHSVFVIAIITWILYRYSIKNYLKKCPIKIALYCPIIAISNLVLLSVFGTYIYTKFVWECINLHYAKCSAVYNNYRFATTCGRRNVV